MRMIKRGVEMYDLIAGGGLPIQKKLPYTARARKLLADDLRRLRKANPALARHLARRMYAERRRAGIDRMFVAA
jgi:hypothetical protein